MLLCLPERGLSPVVPVVNVKAIDYCVVAINLLEIIRMLRPTSIIPSARRRTLELRRGIVAVSNATNGRGGSGGPATHPP